MLFLIDQSYVCVDILFINSYLRLVVLVNYFQSLFELIDCLRVFLLLHQIHSKVVVWEKVLIALARVLFDSGLVALTCFLVVSLSLINDSKIIVEAWFFFKIGLFIINFKIVFVRAIFQILKDLNSLIPEAKLL